MTDIDLFGLAAGPMLTPQQRKKMRNMAALTPKGYAAVPGTGPAGETCKTCRHHTHVERAKKYQKCALMRRLWTGGPGTDIKASSPACKRWEAKPTPSERGRG